MNALQAAIQAAQERRKLLARLQQDEQPTAKASVVQKPRAKAIPNAKASSRWAEYGKKGGLKGGKGCSPAKLRAITKNLEKANLAKASRRA